MLAGFLERVGVRSGTRAASKRKRDAEDPSGPPEPSTVDSSAASQSPASHINAPTPTPKSRRTSAKSSRKQMDTNSTIVNDENALPVTPTKRKKTETTAPQHLPITPSRRKKGLSKEKATPQRHDRSAKKKTVRWLLTRGGDAPEDDEIAQGEQALAEDILDEPSDAVNLLDTAGAETTIVASVEAVAEGEPPPEAENGDQIAVPEGDTPQKRGRGRPRGTRNIRTPTPPRDAPAHERYFYQNKPATNKSSDSTLNTLELLTHEEYFKLIKEYTDPHSAEQDFLHSLHARSFDQWVFELEEGFNICLFGYGSKKALLSEFTAELAAQMPARQIVVVNGCAPNLTIRDVLGTVAKTMASLQSKLLGAQPADMLDTILTALDAEEADFRITLVIHSFDSISLRRSSAQTLIARLAASPRVCLVASCDHPNFPVMWDASILAQFRFLFHDVTTFRSFDAELNVVDDVNELFGRTGRRVGGREGVMYVLKSLTENARRLYALLVAEQLSLNIELEAGGGRRTTGPDAVDVAEGDDGEDADLEAILAMAETDAPQTPTKKGRRAASSTAPSTSKPSSAARRELGIEYRGLYRQAMAQLIATNEMGFRTLLKEFHDHEMLVSRKDRTGAEMLSVPFSNSQLEMILEDLEL